MIYDEKYINSIWNYPQICRQNVNFLLVQFVVDKAIYKPGSPNNYIIWKVFAAAPGFSVDDVDDDNIICGDGQAAIVMLDVYTVIGQLLEYEDISRTEASSGKSEVVGCVHERGMILYISH